MRHPDYDGAEAYEDTKAHLQTVETIRGDRETPLRRLERQRDEFLEALRRIAMECGNEAMACECGPPKTGEACSKCEIRYVACEALANAGVEGWEL